MVAAAADDDIADVAAVVVAIGGNIPIHQQDASESRVRRKAPIQHIKKKKIIPATHCFPTKNTIATTKRKTAKEKRKRKGKEFIEAVSREYMLLSEIRFFRLN